MTGLTEKPEKFKKQTETPCWPTEKLETKSFEKQLKEGCRPLPFLDILKHVCQNPTKKLLINSKSQLKLPAGQLKNLKIWRATEINVFHRGQTKMI